MLEHPTEAAFDFRDDRYVPLELDSATLSEIYLGNHTRLHPTARPLDRELIAYRAREMLTDIEARRVPYENEARYTLEEENMRSVIAYFK